MNRLRELMKAKADREGTAGRLQMASAVGRGERMIVRYIKGESAPSSDQAYKLALACGCTPEEAQKLSSEASSLSARETA